MIEHPTLRQIQVALDVLLWLHPRMSDGALRDEISHVRSALDYESEALLAPRSVRLAQFMERGF